jgi:hypothetical protein
MLICVATKNREAAVGVQVLHLQERWGAATWRVQTQVLLDSRSALCLGGKRPSRDVRRTPSGGGQLQVAR